MTAAPPGEKVGADRWMAAVAECVAAGYAYLDLLTAVDGPDTIEIVIHLVDPATHRDTFLHTAVPRESPAIGSLVDVLPAAAWHEREMHEMFGLDIIGHPDLRPLLLSPTLGIHPLRKETVLASRAVHPWPGAAEEPAGTGRRSRRSTAPPGVPPGWLREAT